MTSRWPPVDLPRSAAQRLVFSILEAPKSKGGAGLDLDELLQEKVFNHCFPLHTDERVPVLEEWAALPLCGRAPG